MTSNLGYENSKLGFNQNRKEISKEMKDFFSIEFLNRIDKIYYFHKLCGKDIRKIISYQLKLLKTSFKDRIKFNYSQDIVEEITSSCNYQDYGARKISKIINEEVMSKITSQLMDNKKEIELKTLKI